jgi:asparagine synthase (glutamine-hydrolysing)
MCGIVGIFETGTRRPIDEKLLSRMNKTQIHRGPDEEGLHLEPGVGIGHRRLSIIDLSSGQQPLFNEDRSVAVVYNGEIYNFEELSVQLKKSGHTFRTRCDTEVIVHAWEEWGDACVNRFRGMFAFAIWDRNQQTLFIARDRLGIKPLYYTLLGNGQFIFASELKALLMHPLLARELNPTAVEDYFAYGYVPDPKTIFQDVYKLPPGHTLRLKRGQPVGEPREYWDVPFKALGPITEEDAVEELVPRLREAVRIRLISEVPLGAFLSGGVDSSAIVAMMASLSTEAVNTCCIAFGDSNYSEAQFADEVARQYIYDEPFADSSAMPTFRVCELARKRVTVALSGDGGDENFAGYGRYRRHVYEERVRSLLSQRLRRTVFGAIASVYPRAAWAPRIFRAKSTLQALARNTLEAYFHDVAVILSNPLRARLFSPEFRRNLQGYHAIEVLRDHADRAPTDHALSLIQYLDFKTYLPGDILVKVDRASMSHSLEVRVPILDHELVEWVSGLPPELKLHGHRGKFLFKKALEPHLPRDVLYRPKMGFAVPLANWFRTSLRERVHRGILGGALTDTGFFNEQFLKQLIDEHQSGSAQHSGILWALLMFEAFQRRVLRGA